MTYKEILNSSEFSFKLLSQAFKALSSQLIEEKKVDATTFVFQSHEETFKSLIEPFLGKPFFEKTKVSNVSINNYTGLATIYTNIDLGGKRNKGVSIKGFPKEFITKNNITKGSTVELMITLEEAKPYIDSSKTIPLWGASIDAKNSNSEILNVSVTQPKKEQVNTKKEGWIQKIIKMLFD